GFIARDAQGQQTTLGRNGSDFTGSIVGNLLDADEIHIWPDVDGVLSADPRLVPDATIIDSLSYEEAMELAYFGAKVIHPQTMAPAVARGIPIWIRNTFAPEKPGTVICARPQSNHQVKGITSIDGLALINLEGAGMIGVPGTAQPLFGARGDERRAGHAAAALRGAARARDLGRPHFAGELGALDLFRGARRGGAAHGGDRPRDVQGGARARADPERRRDRRLQHSFSGRRRHGRHTGCRGQRVFLARERRRQRARDRAGILGAQHLDGRRSAAGGARPGRGALGVLPVAAYGVDRPGPARSRRRGAARPDRAAGRAADARLPPRPARARHRLVAADAA